MCKINENSIKESRSTITVVRVEPGKKPFVKEMDNNLEGIQNEVKGYFEQIVLSSDVLLLCNEEGHINHMKPNRRVGNSVICGPFVLVGYDGGEEYISLTSGQIKEYVERFDSIESFAGDEPELHGGQKIISWWY